MFGLAAWHSPRELAGGGLARAGRRPVGRPRGCGDLRPVSFAGGGSSARGAPDDVLRGEISDRAPIGIDHDDPRRIVRRHEPHDIA